MTRGELTVVRVRAQTLADMLRLHVHVLRELPLPKAIGYSTLNTVWHAQRLASACDRALGTRGRHDDYDNAAGQGRTTGR